MVDFLLLRRSTRGRFYRFVRQELSSLRHHGTCICHRQLQILFHDTVTLEEGTVGIHHRQAHATPLGGVSGSDNNRSTPDMTTNNQGVIERMNINPNEY